MKKKKPVLLIGSLLFCLTGVFYYFLPFSGDDWAWGGSEGLQRLANGFDNYNGRYLGNLFVIAMTRNVFFRVIIMAATILLICHFIAKIVSNKHYICYFIATYSFLMFLNIINYFSLLAVSAETLLWISGFSNYVISSVFLLFNYYLLTQEQERYNRGKYGVLLFLTGMASSLFVENYTLFSIAFCLLVAGVHFLKTKKIKRSAVFCFAGATIGAVIMFSNSSYKIMSPDNKEKTMRAIGFGDSLKATFETLRSFLLCDKLHILFTVGLCLFLLLLVLLPVVRKKATVKIFLPLISCVLLTAPLLFTNSGYEKYIVCSRCYFMQYLFVFISTVYVLRCLPLQKWAKNKTAIHAVMAVCFTALCVGNGMLIYQLSTVEADRTALIGQDLSQGRVEIRVLEYPDPLSKYHYCGNDIDGIYENRVKEYYEIPQDKTLVLFNAEEK